MGRKVLTGFAISLLLVSSLVSLSSPIPITSDDGQFNPLADQLPPKGHPKLDSALNKLASRNATASRAPSTPRALPQAAEETVRIIVESVKRVKITLIIHPWWIINF